MIKHRNLIITFLILVQFLSCSKNSENPLFSDEGKLELIAYRDEGSALYVIKPDGSNKKLLTDSVPAIENMVWSHDGKTLLFSSNAASGLYSIKNDGTELRNFLTDLNLINPAIDYSPNGDLIAFEVIQDNSNQWVTEIWISSPNGENPFKLTAGREPRFSPNGQKILFIERDSIGIINIDGSNRKIITKGNYYLVKRVWSPDGSKIVFTRNLLNDYSDSSKEIFIINLNTKSEQRLTLNNSRDDFAQWSPDGKKIFFWRGKRTVNWDLYLFDLDNQKEELFLKSINTWEYPISCWSPDGSRIAFGAEKSFDIININSHQRVSLVPFSRRFTILDWTVVH